MKLKNCVLIFLSIFTIACNEKIDSKEKKEAEKPQLLVNKKIIYEFLNYNLSSENSLFENCESILNQNPLPIFTERDSLALLKMNSIFSKDDIQYIFKQSKFSRQFRIEQKYIKNKKVIELDTSIVFGRNKIARETYWDEFNKSYYHNCIINLPLFSLDKQSAIVKISYQAEDGIYIYHKKDGKWQVLKTMSLVVY
jgi:hypothetical protein